MPYQAGFGNEGGR